MQFPEAGGRWETFPEGCPLICGVNRGGDKNVMGTVLLSVLCSHWSYARINRIRGGGGYPEPLEMSGTVSEDAVRMAMRRIDGGAIGYNVQKSGCPSHMYHSYFVTELRVSLGVEVRPGNEHAGVKGLPGLWKTLGRLACHQWPIFARGD